MMQKAQTKKAMTIFRRKEDQYKPKVLIIKLLTNELVHTNIVSC